MAYLGYGPEGQKPGTANHLSWQEWRYRSVAGLPMGEAPGSTYPAWWRAALPRVSRWVPDPRTEPEGSKRESVPTACMHGQGACYGEGDLIEVVWSAPYVDREG